MSTLVLAGRVVLSLACVLGLIWYAQRRFAGPLGRRRPVGPQLSVVGRQTLGRHSSVAVLAAGDRRLLIGVTEHGVTLLTELDRCEPAESEVPTEADALSSHAPSPYTAASSAATAAALAAAAPVPTSATARLLARLPVQREEIDVSSLLAGSVDNGPDTAPVAVGQTGGPLDGSILAPSTWRRAARAVRR